MGGIDIEGTANHLSALTDTLSPNYTYWREHGDEWADEYDRRKKAQVLYHIEELMLADYLTHSAPARVLEYGCGMGRHLSYLSKISYLEVYGYDQSQTMVNNCLRWTSQAWLDQYVAVGPPVGKLPYADQYFDIVFTAEVLVHVSPGDLEAVLAELIRISRWQVLHLEPSLFFKVLPEAHDGCWNHDLISIYHKLGYGCELLSAGFEVLSPYRVVLDQERKTYSWSPVILALLRRLEQDIQPRLNQVQVLNDQLAAEQSQRQALADQLAAEQSQRQALADQLAAEQSQRQALADQLAAEQSQRQALAGQLASQQEANRKLGAQLNAFERQLAGILQTDDARGEGQAAADGAAANACQGSAVCGGVIDADGQATGTGEMQIDKAGHKRRLDVTEQYKSTFRKILLETYFANWDPAHLNSEAGERGIEDHVCNRMLEVEDRVLPWVSEVYDITGKSVLEIGCGTGSATVPFALRAHTVHSYDIDERSLKAVKQRAALLGAKNIDLRLLDASWAQSEEGLKSFSENVPRVDIILLMALLEHLTISERINVLRALWEILKPGGILIVYETPNRIGYFDWHSFLLPFFHYLPDQLAQLYSVKTPRAFFRVDPSGDLNENLYRLGRGVSYHEFELALNFEDLAVINDGYSKHLRHRQYLSHKSFDEAVLEIFEEHLPHIPRGFAKPSLDLIIRKERDRLEEHDA
jgi:SAM-dependent methyltransferase